MIIAAVGDVHSPQFYEGFVKAVDALKVKPELFLIAGDMINRGQPEEYDRISNALFGKITCPIVACFGNQEVIPDSREAIRSRHPEIKFLDDDSIILKIGRISVGIIGTLGSLDTPTKWQRANIPNIEKIYKQRVDFVDRHLKRLMVDFKILLIHYAPTYKILEGENPRFYPFMGSVMYENLFMRNKPDLVVCGHSHKGKKLVWVDTVPVYNVALPVNREIVIIDTEKLKPGITKFIE